MASKGALQRRTRCQPCRDSNTRHWDDDVGAPFGYTRCLTTSYAEWVESNDPLAAALGVIRLLLCLPTLLDLVRLL